MNSKLLMRKCRTHTTQPWPCPPSTVYSNAHKFLHNMHVIHCIWNKYEPRLSFIFQDKVGQRNCQVSSMNTCMIFYSIANCTFYTWDETWYQLFWWWWWWRGWWDIVKSQESSLQCYENEIAVIVDVFLTHVDCRLKTEEYIIFYTMDTTYTKSKIEKQTSSFESTLFFLPSFRPKPV